MTTSASSSSPRQDRMELYQRVFPYLRQPSATATGQREPRYGTRVWSFCPIHPDGQKQGRRSLSLDPAWGLTCFAGCDFKDILDALGVPMPSKNGHQPLGQIVATYDYLDRTGELLFQVLRYQPKDFRQRRPDGNGGWHWNLDGVQPVLYRLPELLKADRTRRLWVCAGEKDVRTLEDLGELATTNPGGEEKWRPEYSETLRGWQGPVLLLQDNDPTGEADVQKKAASLSGRVVAVKPLLLPGLLPGGDVTDWLAMGHTREELLTLADAAPAWQPKDSAVIGMGSPAECILPFMTGEEFAAEVPETPDYIVTPWVVAGSITELDAKPKAGKTTWLLDMCRHVVDGTPFMGQPAKQTKVMYLSEQPRASLGPALERAGLLRSEFTFLCFPDTIKLGLKWPQLAAIAIAECQKQGIALLAVDTLAQWARIPGDGENSSGAALEAMAPLQDAARAGIGVIITRHERKSGGEVGDSARGSSAFAGAVDTILSFRRTTGNARSNTRVISGLSRFPGVPESLVVEWGANGYEAIGSEAAVAVKHAKDDVLDSLPAAVAAAMTLDELVQMTGAKRTALQQALRDLTNDGTVQRIGKGAKGNPYRWHRLDPDSADSAAPIQWGLRQNEYYVTQDAGKDPKYILPETPVSAAERILGGTEPPKDSAADPPLKGSAGKPNAADSAGGGCSILGCTAELYGFDPPTGLPWCEAHFPRTDGGKGGSPSGEEFEEFTL